MSTSNRLIWAISCASTPSSSETVQCRASPGKYILGWIMPRVKGIRSEERTYSWIDRLTFIFWRRVSSPLFELQDCAFRSPFRNRNSLIINQIPKTVTPVSQIPTISISQGKADNPFWIASVLMSGFGIANTLCGKGETERLVWI